MVNPIFILDNLGVFSAALSGALASYRKNHDFYGLVVIAGVNALGGGILRDILIGQIPPIFLTDFIYWILIFVAVVSVSLFAPKIERSKRLLVILDALGLGTFTVIGVNTGIAHHITWNGAILCGVVTGTVGGLIRDIILFERPFILSKEFYASTSLLGASIYYIIVNFNILPLSFSMFFCLFLITGMRLVSYYYNWALPRPKVRHIKRKR